MGGFARRIRLDGRFVFPLPESLEAAAAAPLLCAGVTVFAPLRRWGVAAGAQVGVIGVGGVGPLGAPVLRALGWGGAGVPPAPAQRAGAQRPGRRARRF